MADIFNEPIFIIGFVCAICYFIFRKFWNKDKVKTFVPEKLSKTVYEELKSKINRHGIEVKKGMLVMGYNVVANVDRWLTIKGEFDLMLYDSKNKTYVKSDKVKKYELVCLRAKSKNVLYRLLGINKVFYLLDKGSIRYNELTTSWILDGKSDIVRYADTWVNCDSSTEYINDISFKTMVESSLTHVQNFPDKLVHLETQTAKINQLKVAEMEAFKSRYDSYKKADDTRIE